MALWEVKKEFLSEELGGGKSKIETSGAYEVVIGDVYLRDSGTTQAQAIVVEFESGDNYGRVNFWFKKGDGTPNQYAARILTRFTFLCKLKEDSITLEERPVKDFKGNEFGRTFLPEFKGKKIGVMLRAREDGDRINLDAQDFYDLKTKKTTDEIKDNKAATALDKFIKKCSKEEGQVKEKKVEEKTINDDDFPF